MRQRAKNHFVGKALRVAALTLALSIIAGTTHALADSFYNWTFTGGSGSGVSASGTFQVNNSNVIVGILNGQVTGFPGASGPITSIIAAGTFQGNDNIWNPVTPFLTNSGISFVAGGNLNMYSGGTDWGLVNSGTDSYLGTYTAALSN